MKLIRVLAVLVMATLLTAAGVSNVAADEPATEPAAGLSAAEFLAEHPGGVLVNDNEVVYPNGTGYVAVDVGVFSISQCSSNKFCMWTSTNYSGSFTYVTGSGVTKTLSGIVKSFWNNRSSAARLYNNAGTSSTCYAAGAQKAAVATGYQAPAKVYLSATSSC